MFVCEGFSTLHMSSAHVRTPIVPFYRSTPSEDSILHGEHLLCAPVLGKTIQGIGKARHSGRAVGILDFHICTESTYTCTCRGVCGTIYRSVNYPLQTRYWCICDTSSSLSFFSLPSSHRCARMEQDLPFLHVADTGNECCLQKKLSNTTT